MKKLLSLFALALMLLGSSVHAQTYTTSSTARQAMVQWVQDNGYKAVSLAKAKKVVALAIDYASSRNLDPMLVLSIMKNESGFRANARSGYGAQGLMQVVPRWHRDKLKGRSAYNPDVSVEVGTQVLSDCWDKHKGHTFRGLNCYSGGGGQKYFQKVQNSHRDAARTVVALWFLNEEPIRELPRVTVGAILLPSAPVPVMAAAPPPPVAFVPPPANSVERMALLQSFRLN